MNSFNGFANSIRNTIYYVISNYVYNFPAVDASLVFYYPLDSSNGNAGTANYASGLPVYDASMMGSATNTYTQNSFVTGLGDLSLNNVMGSSATAYVQSNTSFSLVPSSELSISLWFSCSGQDISGTLISLYQPSIDSSIRLGLFGSQLIGGYYTPPPPVTYAATGTYTTNTYGKYTILTYTSGSGTFTPTNTNLKVGYIVVGGGSAGLKSYVVPTSTSGNMAKGGAGGNGGAGAYSNYTNSNLIFTNNTLYTIVIGNGSTVKTTATGGNGGNSSISYSSTNIINAQGGTATYNQVNTEFKADNTASASGGVFNFNGGNGNIGATNQYPAITYGNGGIGALVDVSTDIYTYGYSYYGGGGGGGISQDADGGVGGMGGNGGTDGKGGSRNSNGNSGSSNKGGGGGGGGASGSDAVGGDGGNGGSGVVIIYFPTIIS